MPSAKSRKREKENIQFRDNFIGTCYKVISAHSRRESCVKKKIDNRELKTASGNHRDANVCEKNGELENWPIARSINAVRGGEVIAGCVKFSRIAASQHLSGDYFAMHTRRLLRDTCAKIVTLARERLRNIFPKTPRNISAKFILEIYPRI